MTNEEFYFGSSERVATTLKIISECCNETLCERCVIQEPCAQDPIKFLKWLKGECREQQG